MTIDSKNPAADGMLAKGEAMRRKVVGDAHVDRSMAQAHPFSLPLQELITEYAWGNIWTRPGLSLKSRSLINLGMLTALRQTEELSVHVKGAIQNECTPEEIREVIMQATIYAGAPAGLAAMRAVVQTLQDMNEI